MRWYESTDWYKVKPKKLKENSYVKASRVIASEKAPKKADNKRTLKKTDAQRKTEQRKNGKKKATRANQIIGLAIVI